MLEDLINKAFPDLRSICFHSDGRVVVKTGGRAKHPKKLYGSKKKGLPTDRLEEALKKLLKEAKLI